MKDSETIRRRLQQLVQEHGEWTYDLPLTETIWTRGNLQLPHTRLRRVLQCAADFSRKPISSCRVLDLGCLEGQFAIEFALHGAHVVGIEIRKDNIEKCLFAKETMGLENVTFLQEDIRSVSRERFGGFDIVVCSGVLYHLDEPDVFQFLEALHGIADEVVVIDTLVSLASEITVSYKGMPYFGRKVKKHPTTPPSWSAPHTVQTCLLTRPSLLNCLARIGFSSVYECYNPPHMNFGKPGLEHRDRCTFVALKRESVTCLTSPSVNGLNEQWPEDALCYAGPTVNLGGTSRRAIFSRIARIANRIRRRLGRVVRANDTYSLLL